MIDLQKREAKRLQTVTKHKIPIIIKVTLGYYDNSVNVQQLWIESKVRMRTISSFLNFEPTPPYQTFFILLFIFLDSMQLKAANDHP